MNELALFAGTGGGILGGKLLGWRTVCAVEKEPYCREVLLRRQRDGLLPLFPIWDDVRTFDGVPWNGAVDIVTAGFPCQPFSAAGRRQGKDDDRNLWPETVRVIREVGPRFAFLENVPHLLAYDYFGEILGDLADAGLDAQWGVVSAAEVKAPHLRKRLWIVANATGERLEGGFRKELKWLGTRSSNSSWRRTWWKTEPELGRVAHGVAHRVDRLRAIGNGQVPGVVVEAWARLGSVSTAG